jgi:hypothetical protein
MVRAALRDRIDGVCPEAGKAEDGFFVAGMLIESALFSVDF